MEAGGIDLAGGGDKGTIAPVDPSISVLPMIDLKAAAIDLDGAR